MKRLTCSVIIALMCLMSFGLRVRAQNGTLHGTVTAWKVPNPVGGSGTIQGYYVFRCVGTAATCTLTSGTWSSVGGLLSPVNAVNCTIPTGFTACYYDPAAGLSLSADYMYAVGTVDSNGNQSSWDLDAAPAVTGTSWPSNPNPASGCTSSVV